MRNQKGIRYMRSALPLDQLEAHGGKIVVVWAVWRDGKRLGTAWAVERGAGPWLRTWYCKNCEGEPRGARAQTRWKATQILCAQAEGRQVSWL
jgi:hypothetical protein